jgi:hypothetical protein
MIIQNKQKDFPVIYLRYLKGDLMYIGESYSFLKARHVRDSAEAGDFDIVKILKAPKKLELRHYWEAYLVLKLKPLMQLNSKMYQYRYDKRNNTKVKKRYHKTGSRKNPNKIVPKEFYLKEAYVNFKRFKIFMDKAKAN